MGLEEEERAGDNDVERCLSGFVGCVGKGAVGLSTTTEFVFSFALRLEPFVFDRGAFASSAGTAEDADA